MKKIIALSLLVWCSSTLWTMEQQQEPLQENDAAAICTEIEQLFKKQTTEHGVNSHFSITHEGHVITNAQVISQTQPSLLNEYKKKLRSHIKHQKFTS